MSASGAGAPARTADDGFSEVVHDREGHALGDVEVLIDMLTYRCACASDQLLTPVAWDREASSGATLLYDPPIPEFSVALTTLSAKVPKSQQREVDGPSILFVVSGSATLAAGDASFELSPGLLYFVGAQTPIEINSKSDLVVARAFVEA